MSGCFTGRGIQQHKAFLLPPVRLPSALPFHVSSLVREDSPREEAPLISQSKDLQIVVPGNPHMKELQGNSAVLINHPLCFPRSLKV